MLHSEKKYKEIDINDFLRYIIKSDKCLSFQIYLYKNTISLKENEFKKQIEQIYRKEEVPFHELMDFLRFLNYNVYCQVKNKPDINGEIILIGVCKNREFYIETIKNLLLTDSFFRLRFIDYLQKLYSSFSSESSYFRKLDLSNNLEEYLKDLHSLIPIKSLLSNFEIKEKQSQLDILNDIKKVFEYNQIIHLDYFSEFVNRLTIEETVNFFSVDKLFDIIKDLKTVRNYNVTNLNYARKFVFDVFYPDWKDIKFILSPPLAEYFEQIESVVDLWNSYDEENEVGIFIEDEIIKRTDVRYFFDFGYDEVLNVRYAPLKDFDFEVVSNKRILDIIRYFFHFDECSKECALQYMKRIIDEFDGSTYFIEQFCSLSQFKFDTRTQSYLEQTIYLKEIIYGFFQLCLKEVSNKLKHIIQTLIIDFSRNVMNFAFDFEQLDDRDIYNLVHSVPQNLEQLVNTLRNIYKYTLKYDHITEEAINKVVAISSDVGNVKYAINVVNRSVRNAINKGQIVLTEDDII